MLSFTVTDNKGRYVTGLKPSDFKITEDGIDQKLVTFGEGNKPPVEVMSDGTARPILAAPGEGVHGGYGIVCWHQRVRAVRYEQLHVSRVCVLRRMPLRTLCVAPTRPIRWRSIRSAAIFRARRR